MLFYAKADTHFLLDIYDELRLALQRFEPPEGFDSALLAVLAKSNEVAMKTYNFPSYDPDVPDAEGGWQRLARRYGKVVEWGLDEINPWLPLSHATALYVFQAIHDWRDRVAREFDESPGYILPNHNLMKLAMSKLDQIDTRRIINLCSPPSEVVAMRIEEILSIVKAAILKAENRCSTLAHASAQSEAQKPTSTNVDQEPLLLKPLQDSLWAQTTISAPSEKSLHSKASTFLKFSAPPDVTTTPVMKSSSNLFGRRFEISPTKGTIVNQVRSSFILDFAALVSDIESRRGNI